MSATALAEKRILVVEDEYFLMEDLCRELEDAGVVVVGPAPSVETALALIGSEPRIDAAILDMNLGGEMAFPVADALLARAIPFIFSTGYGEAVIDERYPSVGRVEKPAEFRRIAQVLTRTLNR